MLGRLAEAAAAGSWLQDRNENPSNGNENQQEIRDFHGI
jgi:hypothetical protein